MYKIYKTILLTAFESKTGNAVASKSLRNT